MHARSAGHCLFTITIAIAVATGACGKRAVVENSGAGAAPAAIPRVTSDAGLAGSLYRSGSRLKMRWAGSPNAEPRARVPFAVYDTTLGRDCLLDYGPGDHPCLPVPDQGPETEALAYLDEKRTRAALLVDDASCASGASPDDSVIFAAPGRLPPANRYRLGAATRRRLWVPAGSGCVVDYEKSKAALCVRPFEKIDLDGAVMAKETILGPNGGAGVIVGMGSDGSILPLREGAEYMDAINDLRCRVLASGSCLPVRHGLIQGAASVGASVSVISSDLTVNWGKTDDGVFAALAPADPKGGGTQSRKVVSLLSLDKTAQLEPVTWGTGRVVLHAMKLPDGRHVPVSLHDNDLGRDCTPAKTDDGRWRCVVNISPMTCQLTSVGEGDAKVEALSPSSSFCDKKKQETCCQGGTVWIPGEPARGPRRFGDDPDPRPHPAVAGRVVRFADQPRAADHVAMWQPQVKAPVYERVEELGFDAFAELQMTQDR